MIEFPVPTHYEQFIFGSTLAAMPHVPGLTAAVAQHAALQGGERITPYALQQHLYETTGRDLHSQRGSLGGDLFALSWFVIGFQGWVALSTRVGLPLPDWYPNESYVETLRKAMFDVGVDVSIDTLQESLSDMAGGLQSESPVQATTVAAGRLAETIRYLSSAAIRRGHRVGIHAPASSVFISYSTSDSAWVASLKSFLEDHAVDVWIAPFDLHAGNALDANLVQSIEGRECLALIVTSHSLASPWVALELKAAIAARKQIVPVSLVSLDDLRQSPLWEDLSSFLVLDCAARSPVETYREILRNLQKRDVDLTRWAGDEGSALGLFFGRRAASG
jgi:hypothetical protein